MNKKSKIFASALTICTIGILLVFAGCAKTADMQTVPLTSTQKALSVSNYSELSEATEDIGNQMYLIDNKYYYIPDYIMDYVNGDLSKIPLDKYISADNPGYNHFLEILEYGISNGNVEFIKENQKIPYLNKLHTVMKMIDKNNFNGAYKKGANDLVKHTKSWFANSSDITTASNMFGLTQWMLENEAPYIPENYTLGFFKCLDKCVSSHGTKLTIGCAIVVGVGMMIGPGGAVVGVNVCIAASLALVATCSLNCVK